MLLVVVFALGGFDWWVVVVWLVVAGCVLLVGCAFRLVLGLLYLVVWFVLWYSICLICFI